MNVTLTPATTPAELGAAATQADLVAYNELLEERNLVGEEVSEASWIALLDEAAGVDLPVELRVLQDGPATYAALGRVIARARDLVHASELAGTYAYMVQHGVALCDTEAQIIDWGCELTDFAGESLLAPVEAALAEATGNWDGANWTHEVPGHDEPIYCEGDIEGCEICQQAKSDAEDAEEAARIALEFCRKGEWAPAILAANDAAGYEREWGDDPTWRPFKLAVEKTAAAHGVS